VFDKGKKGVTRAQQCVGRRDRKGGGEGKLNPNLRGGSDLPDSSKHIGESVFTNLPKRVPPTSRGSSRDCPLAARGTCPAVNIGGGQDSPVNRRNAGGTPPVGTLKKGEKVKAGGEAKWRVTGGVVGQKNKSTSGGFRNFDKPATVRKKKPKTQSLESHLGRGEGSPKTDQPRTKGASPARKSITVTEDTRGKKEDRGKKKKRGFPEV